MVPGPSVALGPEDFPQIALGTLPNLYPFIVMTLVRVHRPNALFCSNYRSSTPPYTCGLYEEFDKAERLLEEHAHCEILYPERAQNLSRN
ncbi:MAG: hypothetical protein Ct9H300mP28_30130 [Pseudomonadota bacterium]|nr:MAG: hypothetical protein Ct9H300mP28_30130 [Pseudomonadota bacterium]